MQQAIPYRTLLQDHKPFGQSSHQNYLNKTMKDTAISSLYVKGEKGDLQNMVKENAVIVFGKKGCCMVHVVKRLLQALGVNPAVYEVDEADEKDVSRELETVDGGGSGGGRLQFPAVFIGGRWFGGLDRVMATHITGELTPLLKQAGALWL